ncbi:hypothetical protein SAMN05428989_2332 [Pseudoxanthomonas sp. GM95]|uniref:hypothetical protein n=1 Tax=Pseudoxanthomonas sp. GM95 TaxID=1881043 RepID=UPI0008CCB732|nr:hypothetical protein [Pseudoxanthomonas sp. GM95]SEL72014.1 hypothetical protein SAMN05428989_2332 [Pseudoxanthomonas sp. GM95]
MNTIFPSVPQRRAWPLVLCVVAIATIAPLIILGGRPEGVPRWAFGFFGQQFFFDDPTHAVAMLAALCLSLALPGVRRFTERAADAITSHPKTTCAAMFIVLVAGTRYVYLSHPYTMDEYAPLLQAHAFARQSLTIDYPPGLAQLMVAPPLGYFVMANLDTGYAMSAYWPGLALLMAPFVAVHLEMCLNPTLSILALWLIGDLAVKASGNASSRGWAMLAAIASPAFTVNAISFYAMPGLLAFNLLYIWLLLRRGWRNAFMAGLVGGMALIMINPIPHALTALPCLVWLFSRRENWKRLPALAIGYLPFILILLGWPALASSLGIMRNDATELHIAGQSFLSGWIARVSTLFTLPSWGLIVARWHAAWKIWIWACPGLLCLPILMRRWSPLLWVMASAFVLTFAFYFLVPMSQGYGWGYRYIHPAWGILPICAGMWFALVSPQVRKYASAFVLAGLLATPVFLWTTRTNLQDVLAERLVPPPEGNWFVFITMNPTLPVDALVQNFPGHQRVTYLVAQGKDAERRIMRDLAPDAIEVSRDYRGSMWKLPATQPHE